MRKPNPGAVGSGPSSGSNTSGASGLPSSGTPGSASGTDSTGNGSVAAGSESLNAMSGWFVGTGSVAAYHAVADASGGMAKVGPQYFVPDCNVSCEFANDTDYTVSAFNALAMQLATYCIAHP